MAFDASQFMYNSGSSGYEITNSCRFNGGHMHKTPSSDGNLDKFTFSTWVKLTEVRSGTMPLFAAGTNTSQWSRITFVSSNKLNFTILDSDGNFAAAYKSTATFSDTSAWYNVVVAVDTGQSTNTNRVKLYVNGELLALAGGGDLIHPDQNYDTHFNDATYKNWLGSEPSGDGTFSGYMAETNFVDGLQLAPTAFGETGDYGEWKPIEYAGAYGTNGFYLDYKTAGNLGNDANGGTDLAEVTIVATDQMLDSPTNNFATLNYLGWQWSEESAKMLEGNLSFGKDGSDWTFATGTQTIPQNKKIYFEVRGIDTLAYVGIALANENSNAYDEGSRPDGGYVKGLFSLYIDGNTQAVAYRATTGGTALGAQTFSGSNFNNAVVGVAVDIANSNIKFFINNTEILSQSPGNVIQTNKDYVPFVAGYDGLEMAVNFGQDSSFAAAVTAQGNQDANGVGDFFYAPPSGYLALCTASLPEPAVIPSENFNAIIYTGNATDDRNITGVGFESNFSWIKSRNTTNDHLLFDSVRGVGKYLRSNTNDGETNNADTLQSFISDGFQIGADSRLNTNNDPVVAWNWKAATAFSNDTSATSVGSIDSAGKVNVDAGFSIIQYVGEDEQDTTVAHGLSKAPELILIKASSEDGRHWRVFYGDNTDHMKLNENVATADDENYWNDTSPTATVFSIGDANDVNDSGCTFISYNFHSVDGYSKVGLYTGNGSAGSANQFDGAFVYTGFKPKFLLFKRLDTGARWYMWDDAREPYNQMDSWLNAEGTNVETTALTSGYEQQLDFLSNGFKLKGPSGGTNASGRTFIFYAVAETPFKYSNAR